MILKLEVLFFFKKKIESKFLIFISKSVRSPLYRRQFEKVKVFDAVTRRDLSIGAIKKKSKKCAFFSKFCSDVSWRNVEIMVPVFELF